jgi:hypothetical protein
MKRTVSVWREPVCYPERENGKLGKALELTYLRGDEGCSYLYFPSPAGTWLVGAP